MNIQIFKNYSELSKATSELIINYIKAKQDSLICLASGHTPIGVFQELQKAVQAKQVDLSKCTFLSLDEWVNIDPTDPGSCLSMLQKDCFAPLGISANQVEFFDVSVPDLQKECDRINTLIESRGGLDIMLVGVGTNGHIGMNEPGTSFNSYAHISELAEETKSVGQKYFQKNTSLSLGITLGLKHLREAKLPIVMANGNKKAAIIAKGLQGIATEEIPLSVIHLIPQVYVMLDTEAASLI
ncbi:MAG: glucosamine-6-phosphate deaminase [Cyclobacteriaceae bacterium]